MVMVFAAGATTGLSCSLCYAGTYLTGSGQDSLDGEKLIYLASVALICFSLYTAVNTVILVRCAIDNIYCRRDYWPQLQPVPGRDLRDRIRSRYMNTGDIKGINKC